MPPSPAPALGPTAAPSYSAAPTRTLAPTTAPTDGSLTKTLVEVLSDLWSGSPLADLSDAMLLALAFGVVSLCYPLCRRCCCPPRATRERVEASATLQLTIPADVFMDEALQQAFIEDLEAWIEVFRGAPRAAAVGAPRLRVGGVAAAEHLATLNLRHFSLRGAAGERGAPRR